MGAARLRPPRPSARVPPVNGRRERYPARDSRITVDERRRVMNIKKGPLFRRINRDGEIDTMPIAIADVVTTFKKLAKRIGAYAAATETPSGPPRLFKATREAVWLPHWSQLLDY